VKREIITIDEEKCDGCGDCIPGCPEGALQVIDGKARLVSDLMCDGLGACLGECPQGAISLEEREAEPYDERRVMEVIVRQGENTIKAHLKHLKDHGQVEYHAQALAFLKERGIPMPSDVVPTSPADSARGCPGSQSTAFAREDTAAQELSGKRPSGLTHWPVQMHLLAPQAPHFQGSDFLLAADCVAFSMGDFHKDYLKGKTLGIACPKLDGGQDIYLEKLKALIDEARINTLTVMIMQVPCCRGLLALAQQASAQAKRKVPIKCIVVGLQGEILREDWVSM
jgi:NAD-dependent dihydropyrimidine dehydrogenase PreA subunit